MVEGHRSPSCKGCRRTDSEGMGNSTGLGEDNLVEGLGRLQVVAERLPGMPVGKIGRTREEVLR